MIMRMLSRLTTSAFSRINRAVGYGVGTCGVCILNVMFIVMFIVVLIFVLIVMHHMCMPAVSHACMGSLLPRGTGICACNEKMAQRAHQRVQDTQIPIMNPKLSHNSVLINLQTRPRFDQYVT